MIMLHPIQWKPMLGIVLVASIILWVVKKFFVGNENDKKESTKKD